MFCTRSAVSVDVATTSQAANACVSDTHGVRGNWIRLNLTPRCLTAATATATAATNQPTG